MDGHLTGVKKTPLGIGPSNGRGGSTRFVSHEEDAEEEEDRFKRSFVSKKMGRELVPFPIVRRLEGTVW